MDVYSFYAMCAYAGALWVGIALLFVIFGI